ncbi:ejaculatory bulb-specific protein 3-like isoform X2 [Diorhabda carinulata]|uniref:ejaculatory bulb-specific protein 3-like isoform X2 n=1 Tax=Diorhabda carinulata TaxID=1163345 RepID=UPI0025A1D813|nr:ejaculatory bulb-specific protein 3-like isoform X2 [Diorhabda carinulata]
MFSLVMNLCLAGLTLAAVTEKAKYTTKYDNVNLEEIVHNDRLLKNYVDCLLEKGKCTPDGLELKRNMPDAIATDCSKCSEKQKEGRSTTLQELINRDISRLRNRKLKLNLLPKPKITDQ